MALYIQAPTWQELGRRLLHLQLQAGEGGALPKRQVLHCACALADVCSAHCAHAYLKMFVIHNVRMRT